MIDTWVDSLRIQPGMAWAWRFMSPAGCGWSGRTTATRNGDYNRAWRLFARRVRRPHRRYGRGHRDGVRSVDALLQGPHSDLILFSIARMANRAFLVLQNPRLDCN